VWLLLLGHAVAAATAEIEGFELTRLVEVEHPGLVKLSLGPEDARELLPGASDLHLFSPDGLELPYQHVYERAEERRVPARLQTVERHSNGWRIRIDAGAEPEPHRALLFAMKQTALAQGVRLESSVDGAGWRLLAESDLFRIGDEVEMREATLGYEPTTDRYLRLDWPEEAGFPEAERIALERSPAAAIRLRTEEPECRAPAPGETVCRLRNDSHLGRRLSLEIAGEGTVAYRLTRAVDGTWQPLSEGVWHLEPGAAGLRVPRTPHLEQPTDLRLELYGDSATPPTLAAYTFDYPGQTLFFRAAEAGGYTLAYGGDRRYDGSALELSPAERRLATRIEPGPAVRHPLPLLPATAVEARIPMPTSAFAARWEVLSPAAEGGAVVRLPLAGEVLSTARRGPADLRLEVADRQLPYLLVRPERPVAVLTQRGQPQPGDEEGVSSLAFELPAGASRLSQLELTTGEGPFRRRVRAQLIPGPHRKLGAPGSESAWSSWRCETDEPLPCRLSLALHGEPGLGRLEIELDDADNPPLAELQIDLWRSAPELAFVWPERGPVHLLAGSPELPSPSYDLDLMREQMLRRSWVEAHLDLEAAAERQAVTDRRGQLLLMAVLAVAALFLIFLLARVLRSSGRTAPSG
jgi:hypothetical protein